MNAILKQLLRRPYHFLKSTFFEPQDKESLYQQIQRQLVNQYKLNKLNALNPYAAISETGFRCYSQFEEDGMILYVLSMIGFKTKKVVEMCCGNGNECMATNLILNHGFDGYLFDGNKQNIQQAKKFFGSKKDCLLYLPQIKQAWITVENVNNLLKDAGVTGEVDLFSLDMDGNDYWIWKAIDIINPRLCVFETHNIIPETLRLTINYEPNFNCWSKPGHEQDFRGVSLAAMVKLSKQKGYRMIGAHRHGFNVFFLREDIEPDLFPEVSMHEVHNNYWSKFSQETRWPLVKNMAWVEV